MALHQFDIRTYMNSFAVNLYHVLSDTSQNENIFFAPASVYAALAMTYAGACGSTAKEMKSTLCISKDVDNFHEVFAKVWKRILTANKSESCSLNVANRLWIQEGQEITQSYMELLDSNYNAVVVNTDFHGNTELARKLINKWVAEETFDKIKECIRPGELPSDTVIRLISAMYFHGEWQTEFDITDTKKMPFRTPKGIINVDMMYQKEMKCGFHKSEHYKCKILSLAYRNSTLHMQIILPNEHDGLPALEERLNREKFKGDDMWDAHDLRLGKRVNLYMPKFRISEQVSLVESLRSLGLESVFSDEADLSGMITVMSDLHLSAISHAAYIDVNEKGTEVVAYTDCSIKRACGGQPNEMKLDHPFLLQIVDKETEAIVFLGRVCHPSY